MCHSRCCCWAADSPLLLLNMRPTCGQHGVDQRRRPASRGPLKGPRVQPPLCFIVALARLSFSPLPPSAPRSKLQSPQLTSAEEEEQSGEEETASFC